MPVRSTSVLVWLVLSLAQSLAAQLTPEQKSANLASFELVWSTVRDRHPDPRLNGLNWQAVHDATRPHIEKAETMDAVRGALRAMLGKLNTSHYAIIPGDLYQSLDVTSDIETSDASSGIKPVLIDGKAVVESVEPDSPAARAGIRPGMTLESIDGATVTPMLRLAEELKDREAQRIVARAVRRKLDAGARGEPLRLDVLDENGVSKHIDLARAEPAGKMVTFGNLPPTRLVFESRLLPGGAGYIRFNEFLDPVSLMPQFEAAVKEFRQTPGIVLDLRGNPGGIGIMAMGIAGFFIDKKGQKLGEMKMRETTLKFIVFPRAETYQGKLAILLDAGSASTTEILAQGLQDLKRARVFGSRSAGAALPSDIIRLPNGDGFQFAQASYTSVNGRVLEGAGVIPDVEVPETRQALLEGHDPVIEAAETWIKK
ncbi:MAG: S41 family peptidase [Terriglobia bacterium]